MHIAWFKRDLRVWDNEAFTNACKSKSIMPLYIIEPKLWKQDDLSYRQYIFLKDCLKDLDKELKKIGQNLIIKTGDALEIFNDINNEFGVKEVWSHQETWNFWTFNRDLKLKDWFKSKNIKWNEVTQNGVIRGLKNRDGWSKEWQKRMNISPYEPSKKMKFHKFISETIPSAKQLGLKDDGIEVIQKGGRKEGLKLLDSFLNKRGKNYSIEMSSPLTAYNSSSRLSTHIAFGTLSIREIVQKTTNRKKEIQKLSKDEKKNWPRSINTFSSRLRWHCHFIQKLEDQPDIEFKNMHSSYNKLRNEKDNNLFFESWKNGLTGYPMVDACMRSLIKTGWLNFRMRAMLMSFASYHLWLPWQKTSKYLATLFTDYEPGIHYSQSQMQSGTTGINAIRIYNPIKQGIDHDPDGIFIKKWVNELQNVPKKFIHMPWENFSYIKNYNFPIVEESVARKAAASKIYKLRKKQSHKIESNKIYIKHGSRKPRVKKIKKQVKIKKEEIQKNLF
jgi:deoxyribodipyrimidine photo-lyase